VHPAPMVATPTPARAVATASAEITAYTTVEKV
jgi:hypothetical protein